MDIAEYANLATIENEHWYYAGKREVVRTWLKRVGPPASGQTLLFAHNIDIAPRLPSLKLSEGKNQLDVV